MAWEKIPPFLDGQHFTALILGIIIDIPNVGGEASGITPRCIKSPSKRKYRAIDVFIFLIQTTLLSCNGDRTCLNTLIYICCTCLQMLSDVVRCLILPSCYLHTKNIWHDTCTLCSL